VIGVLARIGVAYPESLYELPDGEDERLPFYRLAGELLRDRRLGADRDGVMAHQGVLYHEGGEFPFDGVESGIIT
jgi:hypothetical protein